MNQNPAKILSASRRTDIPAFYPGWFMNQIHAGFFNIKNPYTHTIHKIDVSRDLIHSIVFWSKNYDPFFKARVGEKLTQLGFNLYFNFTINSDNTLLEPNLPSLEKRLVQLDRLVQAYGPEKISWRFDPICFYCFNDKGPVKNNLADFPVIVRKASNLGLKKCVTSFFDNYKKISKRLKFLYTRKKYPLIVFRDPPMDRKTKIIQRMSDHLASAGIKLYMCCENKVLSHLGDDTIVLENSCIDGPLLKKLFGGNPYLKKDYGQRSKKGCNCTISVDIGSYDEHPCFHDCIFCYANPQIDTLFKKNNLNEN